MKTKNKIIIFLIIIFAVIAIMLVFSSDKNEKFLENEPEEKIIIFEPKEDALIDSPLIIKGEARGFWFFEGSFPIKLFDNEGKVLAIAIAQAEDEWMTEDFVPFFATLNFISEAGGNGELVFQKDNPSGLSEHDDEVRLNVKFSAMETSEVLVFFNNNNLDPEITCVKVFPVKRKIKKTEGMARAALLELLLGPSEQEEKNGYTTAINDGVKINNIIIEDGIAKVDFNEMLNFQIGGSCLVGAIDSQIKETLKQFPTVKEVIISVNGESEGILEP